MDTIWEEAEHIINLTKDNNTVSKFHILLFSVFHILKNILQITLKLPDKSFENHRPTVNRNV